MHFGADETSFGCENDMATELSGCGLLMGKSSRVKFIGKFPSPSKSLIVAE